MLAGSEKTLPRVSRSLRILLESLIDYAGLFPPAALSMEKAVENYARYRRGPFAWALGRFVVPAARVAEVPPHFPLAVVSPGREVADDVEYVEIKSLDDLQRIAPPQRAKIRTGGVTADAFPDARFIAGFLRICKERGIKFKATAGLHHPVRCVRPLTYEPDAPIGTMHGFVNLFIAAALVEHAEEILKDDDPRSFAFDDDGAQCRDRRLTLDDLRELRSRAISFGSCSFEEPIDDSRKLGWL